MKFLETFITSIISAKFLQITIVIILFVFWLQSIDATIKMHKIMKNMEKMQQSTVNLLDKLVEQIDEIQIEKNEPSSGSERVPEDNASEGCL